MKKLLIGVLALVAVVHRRICRGERRIIITLGGEDNNQKCFIYIVLRF